MSATPIRGRIGFSILTMFGKNSLVRTPRMVGTSTTWNVLRARPCKRHQPLMYGSNWITGIKTVGEKTKYTVQEGSIIYCICNPLEHKSYSLHTLASTGTRVPARVLVRRGVMMMAPSVDAVVIRTERATSPCAM